MLRWAVHYGPGHFEWYYPFDWLDIFFRTPFNHIGLGDIRCLVIPRNLFILSQHRLYCVLGVISREAAIAHQSPSIASGLNLRSNRVDLSKTVESDDGQ